MHKTHSKDSLAAHTTNRAHQKAHNIMRLCSKTAGRIRPAATVVTSSPPANAHEALQVTTAADCMQRLATQQTAMQRLCGTAQAAESTRAEWTRHQSCTLHPLSPLHPPCLINADKEAPADSDAPPHATATLQNVPPHAHARESATLPLTHCRPRDSSSSCTQLQPDTGAAVT